VEFSFFSPVKIVFGRPVTDVLTNALAEAISDSDLDSHARCALLVSDPGIAGLGLLDQLSASLRDNGWAVHLFTDVESNPTVSCVQAGVEAARTSRARALVAVGGGSVIDVAKAVGLLVSNGGDYADYQWRGRPITNPILPLVAVPTTSGTGSEVTRVAVIADEETHFKKGVLSHHMLPRVAIIDPALTASLPSHLTAATGADVLVHALEAFVGKRANPITDALAIAAMSRTWRFLPRAARDGDDQEARQEMALASTLAGMAFDQSGLGIIHSLAGPLAEHYDLHHGLCTGLLLPYGLAFNLPALRAKREALLQALDLPGTVSDDDVVEQTRAWVRGLGLPLTLSELGIAEPDLSSLAQEAARMVLLPNNPRPATAEDCELVLTGML
jgi:alcohol dehydrogenase